MSQMIREMGRKDYVPIRLSEDLRQPGYYLQISHCSSPWEGGGRFPTNGGGNGGEGRLKTGG